MDTLGRVKIVLVDEGEREVRFRWTTMDYIYLPKLDGCNSVYTRVDSMFAMWF